MAKYKWWKVVSATTRKDNLGSGLEYVLLAEHEGERREFVVSFTNWTVAQEKGGFPIS